MRKSTQFWLCCAAICLLLLVFAAGMGGMMLHRQARAKIAVIPRTSGTFLWESEHVGAAHVAKAKGLDIYWNAPMREDDVQGQIELVNRVMQRGAKGLILTPVEALPLQTTVYRLMQKGTPVVVVGTELGIDAGKKLSYVLSDERMAGQLAGRRLGEILHGKGNIAVVGINHRLSSTSDRASSLEKTLSEEFPGIHVVYRSLAMLNASQEQQAADKLLAGGETIDAIVALNETATRGSYYALSDKKQAGIIPLIGFDQDMMSQVRHGGVDALVMQDTNRMGEEAMKLMEEELHGGSSRAYVVVPPFLTTRKNIDAPEVNRMVNLVWFD